MRIRPYDDSDQQDVIGLWTEALPYSAPHNNPALSIRNKIAVEPELLLVAEVDGVVVGTVMGGYDGHRGWIYSLAVRPQLRRQGIGSSLVGQVEAALIQRGCVKINLQVLASNAEVIAFYERLGYGVEERVSMGKLLVY